MHLPDPVDEPTALAHVLAVCDPRAGDDAAVLAVGGGRLCVSTDSTVAGVHAPPSTTSHALGRRAAARAISDLAAQGAAPLAMTCAVLVPPSGWADAVALVVGLAERGREQSMPLVGGDLARSDGPLTAVVTVLGRPAAAAPRAFATRSGGRAGDVLVVTGVLGRAGHANAHDLPIPEPPDRLRAGAVLARHATAMTDVSDGVARDAANIARASQVDLTIELDDLPVAGDDPLRAASWGDDYELLALLPPDRLDRVRRELLALDPPIPLRSIGAATDGAGVVRARRAGAEVELPTGFVHR
jgi:thiamine-monophosphate kinase